LITLQQFSKSCFRESTSIPNGVASINILIPLMVGCIVVNTTKTANKIVHIGSAILYSG